MSIMINVIRRKEWNEMKSTSDNRQIVSVEKKLVNEIADMKFSFRKLVKVIELDALISFYNR